MPNLRVIALITVVSGTDKFLIIQYLGLTEVLHALDRDFCHKTCIRAKRNQGCGDGVIVKFPPLQECRNSYEYKILGVGFVCSWIVW